MNWAEFQLAIASLNTDPVPLGSMSGIAHDNATRDVMGKPAGQAMNNDYASLIGGHVRGDFVWLGIGADRVQAGGSGGHPLLLGMRTGFCAGRIEDYGFFFHSGHFHPEVENAIPFLIDFIERSCATLGGGARDTEVDRLVNLQLRFYRPHSTTETYFTTFAELAVRHARVRATPVLHLSGASEAPKEPITGYKDGPWGMKIPIYGALAPTSLAPVSLSSGPSISGSTSALALHGSLSLAPPPTKFIAKPTIAELPPSGHGASLPSLLAPHVSTSSTTTVSHAETVPLRPLNLGVTPTGQYFAGLHLARAIWMPDGERQNCARCHAGFSFFTRKHHCRKCGDLFCNNCSNQTRIVNRPVTAPNEDAVAVSAVAVRVCLNCVNRHDL